MNLAKTNKKVILMVHAKGDLFDHFLSFHYNSHIAKSSSQWFVLAVVPFIPVI